ncbi:uncharacterized protein LOC143627172 [Bidens hawaiensis]|uniref:uncharacterized protein LOC143627172 n=1 Tax=Bidens hawaiensis TaxID=980011 RepID=UPI00404A1320
MDSGAVSSPAVGNINGGEAVSGVVPTDGQDVEVSATFRIGTEIGAGLEEGVGEVGKADWIRGLKTCNGVHFVAIQETKRSCVSSFLVNRFWGRSVFEFDSVDAIGRSGGVISIWDPSIFCRTGFVKHRRFMVTSGLIRPLGCLINIFNVYAPNDPGERRILWQDMLMVRGSVTGLCIFLEDFNEVCCPEDRLNSEFVASNAATFNEFIENAGLEEYLMGGGVFTYRSDKGDKFSKLDRVLVCKDFMSVWPLASLTLLSKEYSDHIPLLLSSVDLKQKSRVRWALEGDENSNYFYGVINANLKSNRLHGLLVDGVRVNEANSLVQPFLLLEIKEAVWDCHSDRAPGPDGYNFKFLKRFWNSLQGDFVKVFNEFFDAQSFSFGCLASFIALIAKVKNPVSLGEFRPISVVGCLNKVISKVLVGRLKKVIGRLISEEQSAFLANRSILDGPLILNELLAWLNRSKKRGLIFKVDIEKAYNSLNWNFFDSVLDQMGFPSRWRKWVSAILSASRASVLVNGSPTWEFQCFRGLRQGDPLSPFLFVIAMEVLTGMMKRAEESGLYYGLKCGPSGPVLSHFLYADDVVFVGKWDNENALNLCRILRCFYLVSGLRVNLNKCHVFGTFVDDPEMEQLVGVLRCRICVIPFVHLVLQVGRNMNAISAWDAVVELFKKRLSRWKAKSLSVGGRITVSSGYSTWFWLDVWVGSLPLCERFPRLFSLERYKGCVVADRLYMLDEWICGRWDWVRSPTNMAEVEEFRGLLMVCQGLCLVHGNDQVVWSLDSSGVFSVQSLKAHIVENSFAIPEFVFVWNNLVPKKVGFVAWRAVLGRLPTFDALAKRNIPVSSVLCPICGEVDESVEHVFVSCGLAQTVWSLIAQWCNMPDFFIFSIRDLVDLHRFIPVPKDKAKVFQAICLVTVWCLWKKRNALVHNGSPIQVTTLLEEIKVMGFLWFKNRSHRFGLSWEDWCGFRV